MKLALYNRWETSKNREFLDALEFNPDAETIDLDCGDGQFSLRVKERIGCNKIMGIDVSGRLLQKAERNGVTPKKADLNSTLPLETEFFDAVVSNQVIEHLFYPVKFMREIHRVLKPSGYAVISTENLSSWDNLVALSFGYMPFSMELDSGLRKIGNPFSLHEKELKSEYVYSHVRIFAWNGLVELAVFLKFHPEGIFGNGHFLGSFGEIVDKRHCRFITLKLRKLEDSS